MKYYLFREFLGGGLALFETRKEALCFANKVNNALFETNGEGLLNDEFHIDELELNPDFKEWWNTNG